MLNRNVAGGLCGALGKEQTWSTTRFEDLQSRSICHDGSYRRRPHTWNIRGKLMIVRRLRAN